MSFLAHQLVKHKQQGILSEEIIATLEAFFPIYCQAAAKGGLTLHSSEQILEQFLHLVVKQVQMPYAFAPFHKHIDAPYDYYTFGLNFTRPLAILQPLDTQSFEQLTIITEQIHAKHNVILLANHQTELDPQTISLLIEKDFPELAKNMIFIAGHRVVSDPLAIPFSMGRNLICIYSKKYIETPPEHKIEKIHHNQIALKRLKQLLDEGGCCIYVAPSGGRDRKNANGKIDAAPFDPSSIEMFAFLALHSKQQTHFHPLALATYHLMPPPDNINISLGETRLADHSPIALALGSSIDMDSLIDHSETDKEKRRSARAYVIWQSVCRLYDTIRFDTR